MKKLQLFFNTIIHLKLIQIYYRFYLFRNKIFGYNLKKKNINDFSPIVWENGIDYNNSYFKKENSFTFLNISHSFSGKINWNYNKHGKLWTYNLNYFDFLNQENISKETGLELIQDFIESDDLLKDGLEPYPISLRGINWVKFLSENQVKEEVIDTTLYNHYYILLNNLEFHLLGNHLLENAFSLLFGAYYFQDEKFYDKSVNILISELNEQVLGDGAHFELSPMYHQIILSRLLDCIQLIISNNDWKKDDLLLFLKAKASLMVSWLQNITYHSGKTPMVNDATYNIAPSSTQLFSYSKSLGIPNQKIPLSESGYRKIINSDYELLIDIGNIGPDYQPGHAHSDTFNFELHRDKIPIIVDTGISTYEKNDQRLLQRSTYSHNTVMIDNINQSEVWDSFRVARRARVFDIKVSRNRISAKHNGYKRKGFIHKRIFSWFENEVIIEDKLSKPTNGFAKAMFHLDSNIKKPEISSNRVNLKDQNIEMLFLGHSKIEIVSYDLCKGFNKTLKSHKIVIDFNDHLKTSIIL